MSPKDSQKRESPSLVLRDVLYIIAILVPLGVTWGVWNTKLNNFSDILIEEKQSHISFVNQISIENKEIRQQLNELLIELNNNKTSSKIEIDNIKDRISDIINRLNKQDEKLYGNRHYGKQ